VQPSCTRQPFIPHDQRNSARKQIYIYAKTADYFSPEKRAFPPHVFARLSAALGVDFVVGVQGADSTLPAGVTNLGGMDPARFYEAVAKSWVLMGIGAPSTCVSRLPVYVFGNASFFSSPTPYDALCLGVPFINPILTVRPRPLLPTYSPTLLPYHPICAVGSRAPRRPLKVGGTARGAQAPQPAACV
jgi:hypothetical protein